jgi:hypothetical protein
MFRHFRRHRLSVWCGWFGFVCYRQVIVEDFIVPGALRSTVTTSYRYGVCCNQKHCEHIIPLWCLLHWEALWPHRTIIVSVAIRSTVITSYRYVVCWNVKHCDHIIPLWCLLQSEALWPHHTAMVSVAIRSPVTKSYRFGVCCNHKHCDHIIPLIWLSFNLFSMSA